MGPVARLYAQIKVLERQEAFIHRYGIASEQKQIKGTIERLTVQMLEEYKTAKELTKSTDIRPTFWHKQNEKTKVIKVA